jgi:hypothetical protein
MTYRTPTGGSRQSIPRPGPSPGHIPMVVWRQPVGGIRTTAPPKPTR